MEGLDGEIRKVLARFGPQAGMPEVLAAWPEAVGPMVAANAWPARIARDGTLHANTSSSAWAFELGQLAPEILDAALGEARRECAESVAIRRRPSSRASTADAGGSTNGCSRAERGSPATGGRPRCRNRGRSAAESHAKSGRFRALERPVRPLFLIHFYQPANTEFAGLFLMAEAAYTAKDITVLEGSTGPETTGHVHRLDGLSRPSPPCLRGGRELGRRGTGRALRPARGDHPSGRVDDRPDNGSGSRST